MTSVITRPPDGPKTAGGSPEVPEYTFGALIEPGTPVRHRVRDWVTAHRASIITVTVLMALTATVRFWNFANTPGAWNDDEGTYVAQAWALLTKGQLAHYTYWYDHPFFGWMQIAGWAWLTDGFARNGAAIQVGRELVAVYAVITAAVLYALCRRLGMARAFSALALILFMVSPLGMTYGRMAYLDAVMLPWAFGSLLAATFVNRNSWYGLLSGVLLAGAVWTKETAALFVPFVLWIVWRRSDVRLRFRNVVTTGMLTALIGASYILFAAIKGELFEGPGHVSLQYALTWQLFDRAGGGFILTPGTQSFGTAADWVRTDPVLTFGAILLLAVLALRRPLWPIGALALAHVVVLMRPNSYTPIPFAVVIVPLGALVVASACDALWKASKTSRHRKGAPFSRYGLKALGLAAVLATVGTCVITWVPTIAYRWSNDDMSYERSAVAFIEKNVPKDKGIKIVTDDNVWPDLILDGYPRDDVDWFYKLDSDPSVTKRYVPRGGSEADAWKSIGYVVVPPLVDDRPDVGPTVYAALKHSTRVASFSGPGAGQYIIYKVNPGRP